MESRPIVECDVIIVGLGCFGLGAAYYMSKKGLKVIGFDKAHKPGAIGSGSVGHGRIWRYNFIKKIFYFLHQYLHCEERYCQMQKESEEIFREIEQKTGTELLHPGGLLYIKKIGHPDLNTFDQYGKRMSAAEINQKYPGLVVPDYLEGVFTHDAGVVRVKEALTLFKDQSVNQGADLRQPQISSIYQRTQFSLQFYDNMVAHIDHQNSIVTLENGDKFKAKSIVVTCGATTDQFYMEKDQFNAKKQLIHCYYLNENKGLPTAFLMEDLEESNGIIVFGTLDGENFSTYKVGNECDDIDPHLMLKIMKKIMPSKIKNIDHVQTCFYSMSHDDEFIFERQGNTVFGFGCNGRGFKHMPYHGKRIYNLVKEADKYKISTYAKAIVEPVAKL